MVTFTEKVCNGKLHFLCSFKNVLISHTIGKIEKQFMTFFKSSGQSLIKFNNIEAIYQVINGVNKALFTQQN